MKNFSLLALCIAALVCTLTESKTTDNVMSEFGVELNEILRPAFAVRNILKLFDPTKAPGAGCEVCTAFVGTAMKYATLSNITIDNFIMDDLCPKVPITYRPICQEIVNQYGPAIINALMKTSSPDEACLDIKVCDRPECRLFPKGQEPQASFSSNWATYFEFDKPQFEKPTPEMLDRAYSRFLLETINAHNTTRLGTWVQSITNAGENPIDWLKDLINKLATNHTAIVDLDNDLFSETSGELRGFNWRGRDCDDTNANIHPGRKTNPKPGFNDDYNCNGISGVDPATGKDYEDELCGNSGQIGIVVMGDSAGAHAEIPSQWVNASAWNYYSWDDVIRSFADEVDLPHMSAYTGYAETGYTGPVSSVYKYMYQRNKCNFRDYQNIAVNGLSSRNAHDAIIRLSRSQTDDYPVLVFLELIGNDVCGGHNTSEAWTTVDKFRTNLIGILDTIDTLVPPGSHLVAIGLADGSYVFDVVNGKMNPAGVTYNQLYDYQNCIGDSMCWGWLNTNETIRDNTTQRAVNLSAVYDEVFSNYTAKNYDMTYYDFPIIEIFANWTAAGNDPYLLIEPVDGFHPAQPFNALLGDYLYNTLLQDHPDWLGPVNPNNDRITQLFGDQGGY